MTRTNHMGKILQAQVGALDDDSPTGLREVFPMLRLGRRTCRHARDPFALKPAPCDNEFECSDCHVHKEKSVQDLSNQQEPVGSRGRWGLHIGRFYHRGHTCLQMENWGMVRVYPDPIVYHLLQGVKSITFPEPGQFVELGEPAISVQVRDGVNVRLLSPISGEVKAIFDPGVEAGPTPMNRAWLMRVRPFRLARDLIDLLYGDEVDHWFEREIEWLKTLIMPDAEFSADGGVPRLSADADLPWDELKTQFFMSGQRRD